MAIVGRGRGSWLRAATGSRAVGEEEVDESVAVPKKGTELDWDALEELDDEGPAIVEPSSSVVLTAGVSSFAFPFGSTAAVVGTVAGLEGGGEDRDTLCTCGDSPGCASSYPDSWSGGGALAGSLAFRRLYRVHRL
jgi:hypothetical protein